MADSSSAGWATIQVLFCFLGSLQRKKSFILGLNVLNNYVKKEKVKFEDYKVAKEFIIPNCFIYKSDLTRGYHHIDIN